MRTGSPTTRPRLYVSGRVGARAGSASGPTRERASGRAWRTHDVGARVRFELGSDTPAVVDPTVPDVLPWQLALLGVPLAYHGESVVYTGGTTGGSP